MEEEIKLWKARPLFAGRRERAASGLFRDPRSGGINGPTDKGKGYQDVSSSPTYTQRQRNRV